MIFIDKLSLRILWGIAWLLLLCAAGVVGILADIFFDIFAKAMSTSNAGAGKRVYEMALY